MTQTTETIQSNCQTCAMRLRAQSKPRSLVARLWRWHTKWCPGWKAYVAELETKGLPVPQL